MESIIFKDLADRVRQSEPLVLSITNLVTINECANGLLAIGASPVMSDDARDAAALASLAGATVLNIGTVNERNLEVMLSAGLSARKAGRPVVLDPVGIGATETRRRAALTILDRIRPQIIKGNFSEIKALADEGERQKGVDSSQADDPRSIMEIARTLAARYDCLVASTGAVDVVAAKDRGLLLEGGDSLLTKITGMGCLLSALTGAYAAVCPDDAGAACAAAMAHLALAGERAAGELPDRRALGKFRSLVFDHLAMITDGDLAEFKARQKW